MEIYAALIGLIGLLAGAFLQFWFSRSNDAEAQLRLRRNECYAEYLESVALTAVKGASPETKTRLVSAKSKLSVYGTTAVLDAVANLERVGPVLNSKTGQDAFISIVREMRSDGQSSKRVSSSENLFIVLFGK